MSETNETMATQVADLTIQGAQVELGAGASIQGEPIVQHLEAAVEAIPSRVQAMEQAIHARVDVLWNNIVANVSALIPTIAHNFIHQEKEALKAEISKILKEV